MPPSSYRPSGAAAFYVSLDAIGAPRNRSDRQPLPKCSTATRRRVQGDRVSRAGGSVGRRLLAWRVVERGPARTRPTHRAPADGPPSTARCWRPRPRSTIRRRTPPRRGSTSRIGRKSPRVRHADDRSRRQPRPASPASTPARAWSRARRAIRPAPERAAPGPNRRQPAPGGSSAAPAAAYRPTARRRVDRRSRVASPARLPRCVHLPPFHSTLGRNVRPVRK